jgi:hypothetical protein
LRAEAVDDILSIALPNRRPINEALLGSTPEMHEKRD